MISLFLITAAILALLFNRIVRKHQAQINYLYNQVFSNAKPLQDKKPLYTIIMMWSKPEINLEINLVFVLEILDRRHCRLQKLSTKKYNRMVKFSVSLSIHLPFLMLPTVLLKFHPVHVFIKDMFEMETALNRQGLFLLLLFIWGLSEAKNFVTRLMEVPLLYFAVDVIHYKT